MSIKGFVLRVFTVVAIVAVVVLAATVAAVIVPSQAGGGGPGVEAPPEHPEYEPERLDPEPVPSNGDIVSELEESEEDKQIVIDVGHDNRIHREDIQPLAGAIAKQGHEISYLTRDEELSGELRSADAFLVIDPGTRYETSEIDRIDSFVENGGRLLIAGEPNRVRFSFVSAGMDRSQVTTLAGRFGIEIGTEYLHNMEHYDGTHEQVIAHPADGANLPGVDRAVVDTAASVSTSDGEVLLRTAPRTNRSGVDDPGRYPVAVRNDDVMAVGDASLITTTNVRVADNEAVAAEMIRFLTSGDKEESEAPTPQSDSGDYGWDSSTSGGESGGYGWETPTPSWGSS